MYKKLTWSFVSKYFIFTGVFEEGTVIGASIRIQLQETLINCDRVAIGAAVLAREEPHRAPLKTHLNLTESDQ